MKVSFAVISWIPAIHGAKTTKNQTPLVHFARLFYNQTVSSKTYQGGLIFSGISTMYSRYP